MHELIPLNLLPAGTRGFVEQVLGTPEVVHRLHELGLCGGAAVEMVQAGSPCIILLSGQRLCFRADEVTSILVKPAS